MLQYIINASAIWLLSLVVFDLFLSRENYHSYNRLYLLSTFILGLVLPAISLQQTTAQYTSIGQPVAERVSKVTDSIVTGKAATAALSMETVLLTIYLAGAAVMLLLLIKELMLLIHTYRRGDKSKDGVWTIIETGKQHSPYSAFRYVYISSIKDYTPEQLRIIFNHEEQHGHLLHVFDLLLMQVAKIVFWFHPLVYMYSERLSVVHEFQADAAVDKAPEEYGRFLIEQAVLQAAPNLSYSFNRSPIKKRILMLTHHSSSLSKGKMLIALPLVLTFVLCFSKNAFSDDKRVRSGNKITYRGNVIELIEWGNDTVTVINPATGNQEIRIASREPSPGKLNNKKIYDEYIIRQMGNKLGANSNSTSGFTDKGIKEYLLNNMKNELKGLKDGSYYLVLDNVIIDEKGHIAYFEYSGISTKDFFGTDINKEANVSKAQQDAIAKKVSTLLNNAPAHIAATVNGEYVPCSVNNTDFRNPFTVKAGKLTAL